MWNEDDTKAFEKIGRDYYYDCVGKMLRVPVSRWQPEYKVLAYAFNVATLSMYNHGELQMLPEDAMMLLANMNDLTELDLVNVAVQTWEFANNTNVKVLRLDRTEITSSDLANFSFLKDLTLIGDYPLGGVRVSSLESLGLTRLKMKVFITFKDIVQSFIDDVSTCTIADAEINITSCASCRIWRSHTRAWSR
jgi:hypothetical protein